MSKYIDAFRTYRKLGSPGFRVHKKQYYIFLVHAPNFGFANEGAKIPNSPFGTSDPEFEKHGKCAHLGVRDELLFKMIQYCSIAHCDTLLGLCTLTPRIPFIS
jgi:hypothetical protein